MTFFPCPSEAMLFLRTKPSLAIAGTFPTVGRGGRGWFCHVSGGSSVVIRPKQGLPSHPTHTGPSHWLLLSWPQGQKLAQERGHSRG